MSNAVEQLEKISEFLIQIQEMENFVREQQKNNTNRKISIELLFLGSNIVNTKRCFESTYNAIELAGE